MRKVRFTRVLRPWSLTAPAFTLLLMSNNAGGILAIVAALVVMLSAMWEPMVSAIVAGAGLLLFGVYQLATSHDTEKR